MTEKLSQVQQILAVVCTRKLSPCAFAIIAKLLTLPGYKIESATFLFDAKGRGSRWKRNDRPASLGALLPFNRASVYRAIHELEALGWLERTFRHTWQHNDPELSLVPMLILAEPRDEKVAPARKQRSPKSRAREQKAIATGGRRGK